MSGCEVLALQGGSTVRQATYLDFPLNEYGERLHRIQDHMRQTGMDAVFVTMRENVEYLSGFTCVSWWRIFDKRFWLVVPNEGAPVLIVDRMHEANAHETSWVEDVRIWGIDGKSAVDRLVQVFDDLELGSRTVGMELGHGSRLQMSHVNFEEIRTRLKNVHFTDASDILGKMRMPKCRQEIERVEKACVITCESLRAGFESIQPGMSEREALNNIIMEMLRRGAETAYNSTNPGLFSFQAARLAQVCPTPVDREIQKGDLIRIDGGAVYRGYCADISRNAIVGSDLPGHLKEAADACEYVLDSTLQAIRPGITSAQICLAAEKAIQEVGFASKRRGRMEQVSFEKGEMVGHGLGFTIHEFPYICPDDSTEWVEGMIGALEFSLGDERLGYVELEDDFVVTEYGCKLLTPLKRDLVWAP
jgi:Xaa-Pro aminopeptidase